MPRGSSGRGGGRSRIPLAGAIAAGAPFESYSDSYFDGGARFGGEGFGGGPEVGAGTVEADDNSLEGPAIGIDPSLFCESGDVLALRIEGDSMVNAGILDGDYAIIRRQNSVEEGEIAAVIIDGEGTLKRWHVETSADGNGGSRRKISLEPENERFDPIEIDEGEGKSVLVIGKYIGLVRGNIQLG